MAAEYKSGFYCFSDQFTLLKNAVSGGAHDKCDDKPWFCKYRPYERGNIL